MSHPLPGQPPVPSHDERVLQIARAFNAAQLAQTDGEGFYRGRAQGVVHVIDDDVPDNAHWKGWVW